MSGKAQNIWFSKALIDSKAYAAIKTATAHMVLSIFFCKRQFEQIGRKGKEQWHIKNNGEIVFTYKEAQWKYGIAESTFGDAIDELLDKGLIDIAASGQGTYRVTNLYAISDRWRLYGTPDYEKPKPRPKKPINRGFQKENQYGRNCGKKKKSTVIEQHSSTVTGQHSGTQGQKSYVATTT
jgi:hypothetical protein